MCLKVFKYLTDKNTDYEATRNLYVTKSHPMWRVE